MACVLASAKMYKFLFDLTDGEGWPLFMRRWVGGEPPIRNPTLLPSGVSPLLRQPPPIGDDARLRRLALGLGGGLSGGIDLVVVASRRKGGELGEIVGEPGGLVRQKDKTVLDRRRLKRRGASPCRPRANSASRASTPRQRT